MIGVASLLAFVLIALLVTRIATVAALPGIWRRVQAQSAFERGLHFPSPRNRQPPGPPQHRAYAQCCFRREASSRASPRYCCRSSTPRVSTVVRAAIIVAGLGVLWAFASSDWVERRLSRLIERALTRWTDLDVHDYVRLLEISGDYAITEFGVDTDEWLYGRSADDLQIAKEGVVVLGIRHPDGSVRRRASGGHVVRGGRRARRIRPIERALRAPRPQGRRVR